MGVFENRQRAERLRLHAPKKHPVGSRPKEEVRERQKLQAGDTSHFCQLGPGFKGLLCPDDIMVREELCTSLTFAEVYLISLEDQDHSTRELWRLYANIAATLGKMKEQEE